MNKDTRFEDRLKRIAVKHKKTSSAKPELVAGVGEVKKVRAKVGKNKPSPIPYVGLGLIVGFGTFYPLHHMVGLDTILSTPPEGLLEMGLADPTIGAAGAMLIFCAALAFLSLFLGKRGAQARGFSWAAMISAAGGMFALSI